MMTRERELLQQALDALDAITDDVDGTGLNTMPSFDKAIDAITALREALAAPEPEPVAYLVEGWHDGKLIAHIPRLTLEDAKASAAVFSQHYTTTKLVLLYAAPPAAPAPTAPVPDGWVMVPRGLLRRLIAEALTFDPSLQDKEAIEQAKQLAASPAAPVLPLTDSELAKIALEDEFLLYCDQDSFNEIARAIEAAHGITGGKP